MACFDEQWPWPPHKESMSVNQDIFVFLFAYIATYIILVQRDFFCCCKFKVLKMVFNGSNFVVIITVFIIMKNLI